MAKATTEQTLEKMKSVNDRIRVKVSSGSKTDISFQPLSWWRKNWHDKDVQKQFIENFIFIRDAFDENKLTRLKFNDIQNHLHYNCKGKDIVIKSRRQGLSTFFKAKFFAKTVVFPGRNFREVPHDPDTEAQFRADFKVMYENLPPHLKPKTKYYSEELIEFKDAVKGTINSRVSTASVQPGHEGKGRGQTITDLHLTEPPFWRGDAKKAATSLLEAAQGGDVAVESTPFGIDWTHQIYQQGKKGEAGWKSFFFEWWWKREYRIEGARFGFVKAKGKDDKDKYVLLLPGESLKDVQKNRTKFDLSVVDKEEQEVCELILAYLKTKGYAPKNATWVCKEVAEYLAWRRAKVTDLAGGLQQFKVEYPENDQDCFEQTGRPVIQARYLKVTCESSGPIEGREYLISADTSLGLEHGDFSAIEILDLYTGRQVYSEELKCTPDLLAIRLAELSDLYNWALIVVERNNTGDACIRKLKELVEEQRIYKYLDRKLKRAVEDGLLTIDEAMDKADFGLPTTGANKGEMGVLLEQAIRTGEIGLSNEDWCEQAKTVVWFDNGKWGALSGYHDDRVMALAICNYARLNLQGQQNGTEILPEVGDAR